MRPPNAPPPFVATLRHREAQPGHNKVMLGRCTALSRPLSRGLCAEAAAVKAPITMFGTAGRYANALYAAAAKKNALSPVLDDLTLLKETIKASPALANFCSDPSLGRADKAKGIIEVLTSAKANDVSKNAMATLAEGGRLGDVVKVIDMYTELIVAGKGEVEAVVTSAEPLPPAELEAITKQLHTFLVRAAPPCRAETLLRGGAQRRPWKKERRVLWAGRTGKRPWGAVEGLPTRADELSRGPAWLCGPLLFARGCSLFSLLSLPLPPTAPCSNRSLASAGGGPDQAFRELQGRSQPGLRHHSRDRRQIPRLLRRDAAQEAAAVAEGRRLEALVCVLLPCAPVHAGCAPAPLAFCARTPGASAAR